MGDATIEAIRGVLSRHSKCTLEDPSLVHAGVMLLLFQKDGEHHVLLNKRSNSVEHHKGEISFPGGAKDAEDGNLLETALRETHEEMGILPKDVEVIGQLDDVATRSGFIINAFVGTIPYPYDFTVSDAEVAEVLEVPLFALMKQETIREEVRVVNGEMEKAHAYAYQPHLIYGATARILKQFIDLLKDAPEKEMLWKSL